MSDAAATSRAVRWEPTIGLEVHVQLATRTKLFCGCAWQFGVEPNTRVCPVCLGHPGVLPVLNERALEQGARAALTLGMSVNRESKFDRKNYFYPDLPKGYQISQYDEPLGSDGVIVLLGGERIGIERLHLEEDAGKAIHDRGDFGLVDFNRAGAPLAEIVSRPEIHAAEQARQYLEELKERLRWAGVSDCDMEKGNLRVDINVSVAPEGQRASGTRTEVKNVNSFASVVAAIEHEVARQTGVIEGGGAVQQETRTWDETAGRTRVMRTKEDAHDYRYFPDPDLPRLILEPEWIEAQRAALPETRAARQTRYRDELGLSDYDAGVLTAERATSEFFEELLKEGVDPKPAANWVSNAVLKLVPAGADLSAVPVRAPALAEGVRLMDEGRTNQNGVRRMLAAWAGGATESAEQLLASLGLEVQSDAGELREICRRAIEAQPRAAEDVRAGKDKAIGALLGFVMKETSGAADPRLTRQLFLELLRPDGSG